MRKSRAFSFSIKLRYERASLWMQSCRHRSGRRREGGGVLQGRFQSGTDERRRGRRVFQTGGASVPRYFRSGEGATRERAAFRDHGSRQSAVGGSPQQTKAKI